MKPQSIVFDLDGTLVDSLADIAAATNFALSHHSLPILEQERIGAFVGDGAKRLIARAASMPEDSPSVAPLLDTFLAYYAKHSCDHTHLMPGALDALDALAHLPLALLTNKPRPAATTILDALGVAGRFCCIIAGGDFPVHKPDPALLFEVARQVGVAASTLVMVGDGPQDIECGQRAGAWTVAVGGGIATRESLEAARPWRWIETLHELPGVVSELQNQ
jgi:phosphoglycolate phosphatase